MKLFAILSVLGMLSPLMAADAPAWADKEIRVGIIGTDTSHVPAFVDTFNKKHPEWKVRIVAAFKGGSPDLPTSADRVEKFAATIADKKYGVEIVGSIDELLPKVDAVLLESVDGRPHLAQATPVLKAGKPVFIDKPLAASLEDARAIAQLSKETGTPFFSSSSYRFHPDIPHLREAAAAGKATKVQSSSPFNKLAHHPDLYFYAIHGVEALYAVMGPGCVSVSRKADADADVTTGTWKDGRIGIYYGPLKAPKQPMIKIFSQAGTTECDPPAGYDGLDQAVAEFFHTRKPPVDVAETLEIFEFMTAAQLSMERNGADVALEELRK
jgi:hypothetical protein